MDSHTPIKTILENDLLQRSEVKSAFQSYLWNKDIPLGERWELFCDYGEHYLPIYGYISHNWRKDDGSEVCWYNDLYVDKYMTVKYPDIIERIECDNEPFITGDNLIKIKEEILAKGKFGFINDW